MSEEGSKMFQAPPKVPSGTAPTGATKGEKVGPDADLNTLKGNKFRLEEPSATLRQNRFLRQP